VGASSQLDHVLLRSEVPLVEGAPALALYAWAGGQLRPVSVKPAAEGDALVKALAGSGSASVRHAISEDGSRAFWSTYTSESASALNALYVRDIGSQETVRLDVVQPGAFGSGGANPVFQGADPGGTAALFTDSRNLTADANQDGRDLYRCELKVEGGELGCELTDLTAQTVNPGESAEVQGLLSGMSEDATHVYFVARGVLDAEQNGQHESAVPGEPNLYLWREGAGVRFIATLSEADSRDWNGPVTGAGPPSRTRR